MVIPYAFALSSTFYDTLVPPPSLAYVRFANTKRGQKCCRHSAFQVLEKKSNLHSLWMANTGDENYFKPLSSSPFSFPSNPFDGKRKSAPSQSQASFTGTYRINDVNMREMEEEVKASAQAKMDTNRVKNALFSSGKEDYNRNNPSSSISGYGDGSIDQMKSSPNRWNIAISAGAFAAISTFLLFHITFLSLTSSVIVGYLASLDPIEDGNGSAIGKVILEKDDIAAPLARTVGRATYESIERSKPKVRALARAALVGDELSDNLRARVKELEKENEEMRLWMRRRQVVDETSAEFKLEDLKLLAGKNGLKKGGTKAQLMMRLLEAGVLDLNI